MSKLSHLDQRIQKIKNNMHATDELADTETLDIETELLKLELKETIE